jgi:hypothetical protein
MPPVRPRAVLITRRSAGVVLNDQLHAVVGQRRPPEGGGQVRARRGYPRAPDEIESAGRLSSLRQEFPVARCVSPGAFPPRVRRSASRSRTAHPAGLFWATASGTIPVTVRQNRQAEDHHGRIRRRSSRDVLPAGGGGLRGDPATSVVGRAAGGDLPVSPRYWEASHASSAGSAPAALADSSAIDRKVAAVDVLLYGW